MKIPNFLSSAFSAVVNRGLGSLGLRLVRQDRWLPKPAGEDLSYEGDRIFLFGRNLTFLRDPRFMAAYRQGMDSGHQIGRAPGSTADIHIEFRVYVECWAAEQALKVPGDFVCCGVNTGINPLAISSYVDFNATGRSFFLFDTYAGIPEAQMSATEYGMRADENHQMYVDCWDLAQRNFAPYPRARLVRGLVPDTLTSVEIERVAYLSIDMNIAYPERKAIEYFWPKLSPGGLVVLDDYAFARYEEQHETMDAFAASVGVSILTLPTGQGLIVKPCGA